MESKMVKIGSFREAFSGDLRVALTPDRAREHQELGYKCLGETGAAVAAGFSDDAYSGIENPLFYKDNTRTLYGDAKVSISALLNRLNRRCNAVLSSS